MKISKTAAFYLQWSMVVSFLAGSSAPTPLYAIYQAQWGFSPITITVVFGIYAIAVLAALLTIGSLSDYVGRRPVLIVAALVQAATMLVFATATGVPMLIAARVIQGLATGAAAGAVGAGMLDIDKDRGTIANAVGPMTGTATGALLSGLLVQYLPGPTALVYLVLFGVFIAQAVGVVIMPETVTAKPGALASVRPHIRVPQAVRGPLLLAAPALIAAWALAGFFGSLGPALVRKLSGSTSIALGGIALFVLAASGSAAVLLLRKQDKRAMLATGTGALIVGVAIALFAVSRLSLPIFFAGAVVMGGGFGASFQGAIRMVMPLAAPQERAGTLSTLYIISYLAMGVPVVIAGIVVSRTHDVVATTQMYGLAVITLAAIALAGTVEWSKWARRSSVNATRPVR